MKLINLLRIVLPFILIFLFTSIVFSRENIFERERIDVIEAMEEKVIQENFENKDRQEIITEPSNEEIEVNNKVGGKKIETIIEENEENSDININIINQIEIIQNNNKDFIENTNFEEDKKNNSEDISIKTEKNNSDTSFDKYHEKLNENSEEEIRKESDIDIDRKIKDKSELEKIEIENQLHIKENYNLKSRVLEKLITKKNSDIDNFNNIIKITSENIKDNKKKEIFVEEMIDMDKNFISKFVNPNIINNNNVKKQVNDFISTLENPNIVNNIIINDQMKLDIFSKNKNFDDIISEIFN